MSNDVITTATQSRKNHTGLTALARRAALRLGDFLVPPQCLLCTSRTLAAGTLCAHCWAQMDFITEPCCNRLGVPFAFFPGDGVVCAAALSHPPVWDRARAAVRFDDHSRRLIHALKYHDRHETALMQARAMITGARPLVDDADFLVPVPLYRWRQWQRRYNQAALLAGLIARLTGKSWHHDVLVRGRRTRSQVGLGYAERKRNVKGAFVVPAAARRKVTGRRILLIDDVRTSGATAAACASALKSAGAAHTDVLTFALVVNPAQRHI